MFTACGPLQRVAVNDPDARPRTPESAVHFMSRSPRALAGSSSGGSSPPSRGRATPADAERVSCKPGFPLTPWRALVLDVLLCFLILPSLPKSLALA